MKSLWRSPFYMGVHCFNHLMGSEIHMAIKISSFLPSRLYYAKIIRCSQDIRPIPTMINFLRAQKGFRWISECCGVPFWLNVGVTDWHEAGESMNRGIPECESCWGQHWPEGACECKISLLGKIRNNTYCSSVSKIMVSVYLEEFCPGLHELWGTEGQGQPQSKRHFLSSTS